MLFLMGMVLQSPLATMYFVHVNCYRSLLILHVCNIQGVENMKQDQRAVLTSLATSLMVGMS